MGMLKPIVAGSAAALASEDAEAGWVMNALGKPVLEGWHGGLKGIDRFRDEYLGTGEGAHAYSHGHYIADEWKTSRRYFNDRQREYAREFSTDAFNKELFLEYAGAGGDGIPMEFKVEGAPSIFILPNWYENWMVEAISMYGKDTDKIQDYISRKIMRHDQEHYDNTLDLIQQGSMGEFEIDDSFWRIQAEWALSNMLGMSEGELKRSLMYDLRDRLPPDVGLPSLSIEARESMMNELLLERLEFNAKRYSWDMKARREATIGEIPTPAEVANGAPQQKLGKYEFQIRPEIKDKIGSAELIDWAKVEAPSSKQAGMYKVNVDAQVDEMLEWEKPLADHPEAIKMGIASAMQDLLDNSIAAGHYHPDDLLARSSIYDKGGDELTNLDLVERLASGNFPPDFSAATFAYKFSNSVDPNALMNGEELSKLLRSKGIKGMRYQDGWTRHKDGVEPSYNYVIYGDDLISIMERGMSTVPMNMLLAMGVGTGLAAPVLNKEIAERFPMPQEEPGMMEQIASNPNVQAAMKHPVTQYIGQQFDNAEWPSRMLTGMVEGIANLTQGESAADTGRQFVNRMQTPYEDTTQEVGQYVLKKTGSPAAAAVASTGMLVGDITNWIGP